MDSDTIQQSRDHDLLISLNSKVDSLLATLEQIKGIETRVRGCEGNHERHSEKFRAITEDISVLQKTNAIWNVINSIAIACGIYFAMR